ncbi:MAG: hypothetical protein JSS66_17985 [Armatimonadetes bacterium]|nr:hypothetical protein [Armatimonadota bacterium]
MPDRERLKLVFEEALWWVGKPDNDFSWSSWAGREEACSELERSIASLKRGIVPQTSLLFAPTGPMQELALSSGWSQEFNVLADAFDAAMASEVCPCFEEPRSHLELARDLGVDRHYAEYSLLKCRLCGTAWLLIHYELEAFTRSGRWFLAPVPGHLVASLREEDSEQFVESRDWYFLGGSYFGGIVSRSSGALNWFL